MIGDATSTDSVAITIAIVGLILSAVGWFVSSWLNARTQKQLLINSLMNEARRELTSAMREFIDWCIDISTTAIFMDMDDRTSLGQHSNYHEERKQKLTDLSTDTRNLTCFKRLEEYETLFPGTALVRKEILEMVNRVCEAARKLADQHRPGAPPAKEAQHAFRDAVYDVMSLIWDLLFYVQNESIGRITGHKVPRRAPTDPIAAIRLVADRNGVLKIIR